jgi:outer membrane protein OmpA-like peptidoglycan-associated protein
MTRQVASLILCGFTILGFGCATKSFVEKRVSASEVKLTEQATASETKLSQQASATETKLTQHAGAVESKLTEQASTTDTKLAQQANAMQTKLTEQASETQTKLRETADRVGANQQAIDAANQQLKGLDTRMDEVGALATDAKTRADAAHAANAQLSQRVAGRNNYRVLETRYLYFGPDQAEIRKPDIHELESVAKALKADVNAVLELQGFADPRGSDRYNYQLARERVEAVTRYLVQRHDIELRQLRAFSMGKVVLGAGEKPSREALAKARRVDIRLLAPWSSWEDAAQTRMGHAAPAQADTVTLPVRRESTQPTPATSIVPPVEPDAAVLPVQPEPTVPPVQPKPRQPIRASLADSTSTGTASPTSIEPEQPATPQNISARSSHDGGELKNGAPARAVIEIILKDIAPQDLGGTSSQH